MNKNEIIDVLDEFKSGCISQATDGEMDKLRYKKLREIIINTPLLKNHVPQFIKSKF